MDTTVSELDSSGLAITCVIHSLAGGGAERVMAGLSSRLALRGHQISLVTFDQATSDRHLVDELVRRVPLGLSSDAKTLLGKLRQIRARHRAIAEAVTQLAPDVVLSFCDRTNIDVLLAIGHSGRPVVVSERSDPFRQSLGLFWNAVRKRVYPRAAAVVALTPTSANYLRSFSAPVIVIPSAIEAVAAISNREDAAKRKLVVGAGRLEYEKGFDRLISAFAVATADKPKWRLVIYGEGSQRQRLLDQAIALGIQDRFELPGWIRPLQEPLSKATIFCLASRYEGFPSVLLESMAIGIPSMSADCESGPRAIVQHGRNGLLVESSIDGLCEGLRRLMLNADERERLGRAGISIAERFSWDDMVTRYEQVLHEAAYGDEG